MKVFDWFGPDQKPDLNGVYETETETSDRVGYQYWDGKKWGFRRSTASDASHFSVYESSFERIRWRPLRKNPNP